MSEHHVSSPAATGGAGTFFEQHVAAYWLAQLLVRSRLPILHDCSVVEVHLQTGHLGWHTDDFLIIGLDDARNQRKLAGQVKLTFTISAADEKCRRAIADFWNDFKSSGPFSSATDRFSLVVQRGTKNLLDHFVGLLDCARAASDGAEFAHRLETPGFISKQAVNYCSALCTIVGDIEGSSVTPVEIWPFLRVLYILNLDLDTPTRQTEALIKTLLEYAYTDSGALESPDASWNELLVLASNAMSVARSFTREQLPDSLKQRYSIFGVREEKSLRALKDHTNVILNGIRSNIGNDFHLLRADLVYKILGCLESTQVTLVSGPAGSGKSVIAKSAIDILSQDYFVFSFRAEEFAQPHLDATLQNSQIPVRSAELNAILASQDRKVLLIESVERLLEKSTRDAFSDLLGLVVTDKTLRIVLTCRDYSVDLVHSSVLAPTGIKPSIIGIPSLDDTELTEVETTLPVLARPLGNRKLRQILRNPYFLDKALQISWTADRSLPESEREFRAAFWRQVVRADDRLSAGMPRRREDTFQKIAVRRARALAAYIPCTDLDPAVVDDLRHDSLVASPSQDQSALRVAPAHDVLEDWAILQWIEEQYLGSEGAFHALSEAIGTHPAIRRAYRKWVAELIDRDPIAADRLFNAAIADSGVLTQFRDDTLVSLLRAPSSPAFLQRHVSELLADNRELLRRIIRLLRVACVTAPKWLSDGADQGLLFNVPHGAAWASVLKIVQTHVGTFTESEQPLLLGLIRDWANSVSWWDPYPDGAESVASIAHRLLPDIDTYQSRDMRRQVLSIIAKIPKMDAARFASLLRGNVEIGRRDHASDTLRNIVFSELEGIPAARDLPDVLVSAAFEYLLCTESDLQQLPYYNPHNIEVSFGLKKHLAHKFFPSSAYRGPWLYLLKCFPEKGLRLFIHIFNHSIDWYVHPRVSSRLEPPFEIKLVFPDGTFQKQWCNSRLWNLYRGTSVGPYVLQSMLMALERWLLDFAKARPDEIDTILLDILQKSNSAALTSVVASVATAFPHMSGQSLLVLLSSPACIRLDLQRKVMESQGASLIGFDLHRVEDQIYEMERKEMHALAHRRHHLEDAIVNLQLGPLAGRVHEILDQHRSVLPPVSEQTEDDRIWRLSMHRMDFRRYSIAEATTEAGPSTEATAADPARSQILLTPKHPEPDIKVMMDESATKFGVTSASIGLLMWALHVFEKKDAVTYDPREWRQRLNQARTTEGDSTEDESVDLHRSGPGIVAAVCARDHWQEMSRDEPNWCVEIVCSEVMRHADDWNHFACLQINNMSADRPCASVIALLVGTSLSMTRRLRVNQALVIALTHSIDEVKRYAAQGVAEYLWSIDRTLAMRCVQALATEATLIEQAQHNEAAYPYDQRRQIDDLSAEAAITIRQQFWSGGIADNAYQGLDIRKGFGARANVLVLTMLGRVPAESIAVAAFTRTAHTLVEWWDSDNEHQHYHDERRHERNYEAEFIVAEHLSNFSMRTSDDAVKVLLQPLLDAINRHPSDVCRVVENLVVIEDRWPNTPRFWAVWNLFADKIRRADWLTRLDDREYSIGNEILSVIFLGTNWKENVRHWKSIERYADYVHALFEDLPPSTIVLDAYIRFLYHIGEQSLPNAFVRVANRLRSGDIQRMLRKTNTVFMLEVLLQRHVYGRPLELKREPLIREAVLFLLDTLVEQGSSRAFRMRDDFVTPISIT